MRTQLGLFDPSPIWSGYGILTRALLQPDGYLYGVGHRWVLPVHPWPWPDYWWEEHLALNVECANPVEDWLRGRLRDSLRRFEATQALAGAWPAW